MICSAFLKLGGRHAGDVLEIFAKRRLAVEIQGISNLLHAHSREPEQVLGLEDDILVNPFAGRPSGTFLDNR